MSVTAAAGFSAAGVSCGLKSTGKKDLALVQNLGPLKSVASVFTSNRCKANPILWSQQVMSDPVVEAIVLNSGGANCYTGARGFQTTHATAEAVAERLGVSAGDVLVCSTGLIGEQLDLDKLTTGVGDASLMVLSDEGVMEQAGLDAVTAGVLGSDVDAAVRAVLSDAGLEHEFVHGTGHGIGLFIHEPPILSPRCNAVLGAGEVVTVEPGLYRKGVGGVRVEDLVVVTDTRCRILTLTPKDLTCPRSQQTI
jgi:glutamate N-acetyltransferase/amino-acid N-acetyltransferase